jgi:flavin reductase (DIM6/NTAB) family NADH-FMN oxidoreductase RutF
VSNDSLRVTAQGFDALFRLVDREVWVVTSAFESSRGGLLATWVSQASIDATRPMVLLGIAPNHFTGELIQQSGRFGLHLLRDDQQDAALNFALGSGRDRDKFQQLSTIEGPLGTPRLTGALAWMEGRVVHCLDGGDRLYIWGEIEYSQQTGEESPLTEQQLMAAATDEQKKRLLENLEHDCEVHRPLFQHWLESLQKSSPRP